jgi:GTPase SAR1 family protein
VREKEDHCSKKKMGCASSSSDPNRLPNEEALVKIANAVKSSKPDEAQSVKLLLLGAGSSGKTTFRKQLRNIYVGFSEQQRLECAPIILENIWMGVRSIVSSMEQDNAITPEFKASPAGKAVELIASRPETEYNCIEEATARQLSAFWKSPDVHKHINSRPENLQITDSCYYFFDQLDKYPDFGGPNWTPSADDCIRARIRSSGVAEEHFKIEGFVFKLFDAGGQRSERRKWIHYFDSVNSVLFMTSLTAYMENLFEDHTQNGLLESLDLFDQICNSKWFRNTPFMVFFNKKDLFEECFGKLNIPLNRSGLFPDAPETTDVDKAIEWQIKKFRARKLKIPGALEAADENLYCHVTTAVSKDNVGKVFSMCRIIILKQSLQKIGFVQAF